MLRQIGFDLNDLHHYPALVQAAAEKPERATFAVPRLKAMELAAVPEALKGLAPQVIYSNADKASEVRLAIAGDSLAVHVIVYDKECVGPQDQWPAGGTDLYVTGLDNLVDLGETDHGLGTGKVPLVKQVCFPAKATGEGGKVKICQGLPEYSDQLVDLPYAVRPLTPAGYEVTALIPLKRLGVKDDAGEFLFEQSVLYAPAAGVAPSFLRLFATHGDRGAFRDASQSARVTVKRCAATSPHRRATVPVAVARETVSMGLPTDAKRPWSDCGLPQLSHGPAPFDRLRAPAAGPTPPGQAPAYESGRGRPALQRRVAPVAPSRTPSGRTPGPVRM